MRIERVRVRNLRALEDVEVGLDPNLTVVIGANNAGKTTLLDAIGAVVSYSGRVPFTELDFRSTSASSDLRDAPPIVIDLWLAPPSGQQRFESGAVAPVTPQIVGDGERVLLRLEVLLVPDASTSAPDLTARLVLLRPDGSEIEETVRSAFPFRDQLPFRAFGPDRDLRRGLGGRWSDWGTLLAEARPDPPTTAAALELLRQGSDKLVSGTPLIGELAESLSRIGPVLGLPSNTVVTLSAAPRDVDEMLRALAIDVTSPADQRGFGADRHGLGTQGALLFGIYAHQVERLSKRDRVRPILTIEEPEAHLHPTAQRAMAGRLSGMPGQVIASSHSPELLLTGSVILLEP
ncbi:MAG: AAA family ATPase [Myxococcales bacterium]|nr:AAA family ATPase [Myxococcales bacterium]